MPPKTAKLIHLIYGCVITALVLILGVALIVSCLGIYNSGPRPYSVASITEAFERISILVYVVIAGIVGGIALNLLIPLETKRPKAIRDDAITLQRFRSKVGTLDGKAKSQATAQVVLRLIARVVTAVIFVGLMVYPAIYFLIPIVPEWNTGTFTIMNLNADIIRSVIIVMIPAAIGLLLCFVCSLLVRSSLRCETEIYKKIMAERKGQSVDANSPSKVSFIQKLKNTWLAFTSKKVFTTIIRCVIVVAALGFVVLGIINGGMDDVLTKAVAICTECIGLG